MWLHLQCDCAQFAFGVNFNQIGQIMNEEGHDEAIPQPTTASSGQIKAIAKDTVHKICSGQVSCADKTKQRKIFYVNALV